jgi:hypothetical protein
MHPQQYARALTATKPGNPDQGGYAFRKGMSWCISWIRGNWAACT